MSTHTHILDFRVISDVQGSCIRKYLALALERYNTISSKVPPPLSLSPECPFASTFYYCHIRYLYEDTLKVATHMHAVVQSQYLKSVELGLSKVVAGFYGPVMTVFAEIYCHFWFYCNC